MAQAFDEGLEGGLRLKWPQASRVIDAPWVRVSLAELLLSSAPLRFPEGLRP